MTRGGLSTHLVILAIACGLASAPVAAEETSDASARVVVGRVLAIAGDAKARNSAGQQRALECDSPVFGDDEIATAEGAGIGLLVGQAYVSLDSRTQLRLTIESGRSARVRVVAGRARFIDSGGSEPVEISVAGLVSPQPSADVEVFGSRAAGGIGAKLCSWQGAFDARNRDAASSRLHVVSGSCASLEAGGEIRSTDGSYPPLRIVEDRECRDQRLAGLGSTLPFEGPEDIVLNSLPAPTLQQRSNLPIDQPLCREIGAPCDQDGLKLKIPPADLPLPAPVPVTP